MLDNILGISKEADLVCEGLRVLTVNVTKLTTQRLETVLSHAAAIGDDVAICLQETKHPVKTGFCWAGVLAAKQGWKCTWSEPPPSQPHQPNVLINGGTALFWSKRYGKGRVFILIYIVFAGERGAML